jgi:hypothetical protein
VNLHCVDVAEVLLKWSIRCDALSNLLSVPAAQLHTVACFVLLRVMARALHLGRRGQ